MTLITILSWAAIVVLWSESGPTKALRRYFFRGKVLDFLECALCSGFWITFLGQGFVYSDWNLFLASAAAIVAELIKRQLEGGRL